jgi:hypothetical protein
MFQSKCLLLNSITMPAFQGTQVYMLPFVINSNIDKNDSIPARYKAILKEMLKPFQYCNDIGFLTIDERQVSKGKTHRRGGAHIDGNYIHDDWGNGGWLTSNNFNQKNLDIHNKLYNNPKGGMIIASNYSACRGWTGNFHGEIKQGGDVSHLKGGLVNNSSFILKPNQIYYGNSQFVHESLPLTADVNRQLIRVTLPHELKSIL